MTHVRADGEGLTLWCPGCDDAHRIGVGTPTGWTWDGDTERPRAVRTR